MGCWGWDCCGCEIFLSLEQEIKSKYDESRGKYNNSNIRFKASLVKSNLCDYSDAYILIKGTITVPNTAAAGTVVNNTNKKVIFKNPASFTDSTTKINNTQVDDAQNVI